MQTMKNSIEHLLRAHPDRERFEELCCLFALGELSPEEISFLNEHQKVCGTCRRLLARVLEKARAGEDRSRRAREVARNLRDSHPGSWWQGAARLVGIVSAPGGWAVAAVLLLFFLATSRQSQDVGPRAGSNPVVEQDNREELVDLKNRALVAEKHSEEASIKAKEAENRTHEATNALNRVTAEYRALESTYSDLKALLSQEDVHLKQQTADLDLIRNTLREEVAARDSLQGQLADALGQLEKRKIEADRAQEAEDMESPRLASNVVETSEAKEILGARDLHIVDVYDVDKTGKSSRTYGRIYYVKHHLLVFYAFDLVKAAKSHVAAAFQAWGFRQPNSTTAESLGLFYLDNETQNRWTLRVSDPQVLSRIDTVFVTVEPPKGSPFPRGRRLLMASLASPANHP